jgi:hypothetical protein
MMIKHAAEAALEKWKKDAGIAIPSEIVISAFNYAFLEGVVHERKAPRTLQDEVPPEEAPETG